MKGLSRRITSMWVMIALCLAIMPAAHAASLWEYNGFVFSLSAVGSKRTMLYHIPRADLPVSVGTIVSTGGRRRNADTKTAYAFSKFCGKIGYQVSGNVSADERSITLRGSVPVRDARCKIVTRERFWDQS